MKKITSKIILLTMIIPIILIFTMGTTIDMTAIMVDIPVTNVEIQGDEVLFVDVTAENNTIQLNTEVSPKEATDKTITYSTASIGNEKQAIVEISKDGKITPKSTGSVKIIATANGGRQDSVQITFYSSQVSEVEKITQNLDLSVGEELVLASGVNFKLLPSGSSGSVTYYTNSDKIKVDRYTGKVTGLFSGEASVIAKVDGIKYDEVSKKFKNSTHEVEFPVVVSQTSDSQEIFSFAGGSNEKKEILYLDTISIPFEYIGFDNLGKLAYSVSNEDAQYIQSVGFEYLNGTRGNINIVLKDSAIEKDYVFAITASGAQLATLTLKKQDPEIKIAASQTAYTISNANIVFGSEIEGLTSGYTLKYESTNPNVLTVNTRGDDCVAVAKSEGVTLVRVKLYINEELISVSDAVEFTVVDSYVSIALIENATTYGLENRLVFGKYEYNEQPQLASYKFKPKLSDHNGAVTDVDYSKLEWRVSDESIASINDQGELMVLADGVVIVTLASRYNDLLAKQVEANFEITCRVNAVNVYDYEDLVWANENEYEIILMKNVMLADQINEYNYREYLANETKLMKTTADYAYYRDNNKMLEAVVRYCFEFTTDVYGNGFSIDANNITQSVEKYNYSVFNGPLNLLALSYGNNSSGNARIKAQDNIVFIVRNEGININNIELKGCSDSSIIESGQANLTKLNNAGTVLEVIGDDLNLNYSRVNNGRTVIRIYGQPNQENQNKVQENPDKYKIVTNISNCIFSYAREFLMKVGTNQVIRNESVIGDDLALPSEAPSKYEHAAPSLKKENGEDYSISSEKDDYFIERYLLTDINLKDSIFYGAGLFCIGFESQFAGLALHGYDYGNYKFSELGWRGIAGTSYPARIKMHGDVRFYDWKEVNRIDSSTLVEGDSAILETVGLDLNVSNLLNKYNAEKPNNEVIYKYQGNDYINGAIVFYGGGKNYSWVDTTNVSSEFNQLDEFSVPLSYFGTRVNLIYIAAGKENFRFMTYNSNGSINYVSQQNDLADGSAYTWIMRK